MSHTLTAEARSLGTIGALTKLRLERKIPAIIYGPDVKPLPIAVDYNPFEKMLQVAGTSSLVTLDVGGQSHIVLVKDLSTDPLTDRFTHVDFFEVSMKKELEAAVDLVFTNESPAVKDLGGTLIKVLGSLTIRCLPQNLVRFIEVDLSSLKTFDDVITVNDIIAPAGVMFEDEDSAVVVKVSAPLTEEQLKAMEAENAADVTKVEVVGAKEKEDESGDAEAKEGGVEPAAVKEKK